MAEQFDEFDDFKVAEETAGIENIVANTIVAKELTEVAVAVVPRHDLLHDGAHRGGALLKHGLLACIDEIGSVTPSYGRLIAMLVYRPEVLRGRLDAGGVVQKVTCKAKVLLRKRAASLLGHETPFRGRCPGQGPREGRLWRSVRAHSVPRV